MQIPENTLKSRIQAGRPSFGMWLQSTCPTIAEIAGLVGLDFVIIDQEHGPGDIQSAIDMMRALSGSPTTAVVRAPINDQAYLKRILDAGAQAVLVPMIDTAAEAKQLVDACLYPPRGRRGNAAVVVRGAGYGLVSDYVQRAHETLLIVPQIETITAVANARDIASVPGVDMVFIGPADLSGSAGVPDQTGAPEVSRLIAEAESAVRAAGKPLATVPRVGKRAGRTSSPRATWPWPPPATSPCCVRAWWRRPRVGAATRRPAMPGRSPSRRAEAGHIRKIEIRPPPGVCRKLGPVRTERQQQMACLGWHAAQRASHPCSWSGAVSASSSRWP